MNDFDDTPRTKARLKDGSHVDADFARKLERESAKLQTLLDNYARDFLASLDAAHKEAKP